MSQLHVNRSLARTGILLLLAAGASGCCKRGEADPTTDPTPSSSAAAPASTPVVVADVPAATRRTVKAGTVDDADVWIPAFDAMRPEGTAAQVWLAARTACAGAGLEMCTETQWVHACNDDASLGKYPHWTVTSAGSSGFVVRGGDGCAARAEAAGFDKQPDRTVLCCTRAIGIRTSNANKAFLRATSTKLAKLESALNRHDASGVASFFDDPLRFYQNSVPRERAQSLMSGSFRQYADQWAVHDICDVSLQATGDPETDTWTAECGKLVYRAGEVGVTRTVYVFGGPTTLVRSLTEPKILRGWAPP